MFWRTLNRRWRQKMYWRNQHTSWWCSRLCWWCRQSNSISDLQGISCSKWFDFHPKNSGCRFFFELCDDPLLNNMCAINVSLVFRAKKVYTKTDDSEWWRRSKNIPQWSSSFVSTARIWNGNAPKTSAGYPCGFVRLGPLYLFHTPTCLEPTGMDFA